MCPRDIRLEDTLDFKFATVDGTGAPTVLTGTPTIAAYPSNSTTELTAGLTLTASFDGRTGLNHVRVLATAANGYAAGTEYDVVITAGTVGGVSVVGYVVAHFSIEMTVLSVVERNAIADALLNRDLSVGTDSGSATFRTMRQALRFLRNRWTYLAGTLTVYKENDTTVSWTGGVTGPAGGITEVDPSG